MGEFENKVRRIIGFIGLFLLMLLTIVMNIVGMSVSDPAVYMNIYRIIMFVKERVIITMLILEI